MRNLVLRSVFLLIVLLISVSISAQDQNRKLKEIFGTITYLNEPLPDVNIQIKGSSRGTKTMDDGKYSIKASVGEILVFSHVSYKTVAIVVEDITSVLNLELDNYVNTLDEVQITIRKEAEPVRDINEAMDIDVSTSFGIVNPRSNTGPVYYMNNKTLRRLSSPSIEDALSGRFSRVQKIGDKLYIKNVAAIYNIDDIEYKTPPALNFEDIMSLFIIKNKALVIIRTSQASEEIARRKEAVAEQHRNQNYYQDDAITIGQDPTISTTSSTNTGQSIKRVSGRITFKGQPVPDVNIKVQKSSRGTKTDAQGIYSIKVRASDILRFSHVSYKTVDVVIEDVTSVLNIDMIEKTNQLKEAVVTARKKDTKLETYLEKMDVNLQTPIGIINPRRVGYEVNYLAGKDISQASENLIRGLNGKVPGVVTVGEYPYYLFFSRNDAQATFIVDGIETDQDVVKGLSLFNVEDIYIIKNKNLIVVRTSNVVREEKRKQKNLEQHHNQNYYSEDAETLPEEDAALPITINYLENTIKPISGIITYLGEPVPDVNITVKNSNRGTKTDSKGKYTINVKAGEILEYSHVSYQTVSVVIEDVTSTINIEMVEKTNTLDEVVVIAKSSEGEVIRRSKRANKKFATSRGNINPETAGYAVGYIDGEEFSNAYSSLSEAMVGKVSGYTYDASAKKGYLRGAGSSISQDYPVAWEVDGVFTQNEPVGLDLSQIKSVHALKSLAATNKYGTLGAGGVIVIQTKLGDFSGNGANSKVAEKFRNQNYYSGGASEVDLESMSSNQFTEQIKGFNDIQKAYQFYEQSVSNQVQDHHIHIASAVTFASFYDSPNLSSQILLGLSKKHQTNPEILKAIAYNMQAIGAHLEVVPIYEAIFKLRPSYAQSYRDLANAYIENSQFKKGWRLYTSYFMQGHDATSEDIGQIIYNEMEYLYFNRSNQTQIKETFLPKNETIADFRNDVRIVFEWNSSEAEFDLEFVSPDQRAYVFEHSLAANQELITDEKKKGYSIKEFFIDDVGTGEWLINFTYQGNKKPEPTYIKVTTFYHWGKSNQEKKVDVYAFQNQREKFQLIRINKQILTASK